MTTCVPDPSTITGGSYIVLEGGTLHTGSTAYTNNSVAVYTCNSGYVLTGNAYSTCTSNAWTVVPSCTLSSGDTITVNNNDTDNISIVSDIPDWLVWVIAGVCVALILLIFTCILACCCHLCGDHDLPGLNIRCYGPDGLFGDHQGNTMMRCCLCRGRKRGTMHVAVETHCRSLPRRYLYDDAGRRYHMDDEGRRCYYEHRKDQYGQRSVSVQDSPPSEKRSDVGRTTFVGAVNEVMRNDRKEAKDLPLWKPHANPVRNINTSTK